MYIIYLIIPLHCLYRITISLKWPLVPLVSSFWFIWIPMLLVYDHYNFFTLTLWWSTLDVRLLTTKFDPRAVRIHNAVIGNEMSVQHQHCQMFGLQVYEYSFFTHFKLWIAVARHSFKWVNSYSAGIDFSRQNLTSVDVKFWRLKSIPAL